MQKRLLRTCPECKGEFKPRRASHKYCSRRCMWNNNGKHQKRRKEVWWQNQKGYIEGRVLEDGRIRRVRQHRWIMEKYLGRQLRTNEDVHHINGNKAGWFIEDVMTGRDAAMEDER